MMFPDLAIYDLPGTCSEEERERGRTRLRHVLEELEEFRADEENGYERLAEEDYDHVAEVGWPFTVYLHNNPLMELTWKPGTDVAEVRVSYASGDVLGYNMPRDMGDWLFRFFFEDYA